MILHFRIQFLRYKPYLFGGDSGGVPRVPIPNTTVKPSSADGTWTAGSWESRTLPSRQRPLTSVGGFFLYSEEVRERGERTWHGILEGEADLGDVNRRVASLYLEA